MARRALFAASIAAGVLSMVIAVSGGFVAAVGGVRVSARSGRPSAVAALVLGMLWLWTAARQGAVRRDLHALGAFLDTRGRVLALVLASLAVIVSMLCSTYSASGADASGYLSQAVMWSRGLTRLADPLVSLPNWPLSPGDSAPLGWRPALERGWQVPTYAPGLPWLMALPHAVAGTPGAVVVVALSAGVAVWSVGALAWQLGGGTAALMASSMLATAPTFLYQAFQPMSDVPVTAAWAACWWLVATGRPGAAGAAAAVAVLVRPNLAPLAAVPLWVLVAGRWPGQARQAVVRFAAPVAAAGLVVASLQWRWYGSPLTSGYGSADDLFAWSNVTPNARLYATWLWDAERAFVLMTALAAAGAVWGWGQTRITSRRALSGGLLVFAGGVTLAYLVYAVFETWSYVRFLLPAIAAVAALVGAAVARVLRQWPSPAQGVVVMGLVLAASASSLQTARALGVFEVAAVTARAREVGEHLARTLPSHAVLLAGEQSGSMRYATDRPIVRWETLDASSLRAALSVLDENGYEAWWVLDQFEEPRVRERFHEVPEAALDRPPDLEGGPLMRTRAWRIRSASDRSRTGERMDSRLE